MMGNLSEPAKHIMDAGAVSLALATLFSWLPGIASLLSIVWLCLRIWETWLNIKAHRDDQ